MYTSLIGVKYIEYEKELIFISLYFCLYLSIEKISDFIVADD